MNWRLRIPSALYRLARDKAGDDASLAALVVRYLERYASGTLPQQLGGQARAAKLSPEERSAIASLGGQARQAQDDDG